MAVVRPFDKMTLDQLTPHLYFFSKLQMKSLKKKRKKKEFKKKKREKEREKGTEREREK